MGAQRVVAAFLRLLRLRQEGHREAWVTAVEYADLESFAARTGRLFCVDGVEGEHLVWYGLIIRPTAFVPGATIDGARWLGR
jgi:hypothetical protein